MTGPRSAGLKTGPLFSLIFPTYNAASFIASTWDAVGQFLQNAGESWEILFVCDGCTDDTPARLTELIRQDVRNRPEQIRLVSYSGNRGKGYAVRQGLQAARGQWRLFTDVDLAYRFQDVLQVAATLKSGADVAIGSRLHPESRVVVPTRYQGYLYRRQLQSLVFSTVVRRLLPLTQLDTQAGLKGLSARAVRLLCPLLECDGFGFDCEMLVLCRRLRIQVAEVPVTMQYDGQPTTTGWIALPQMLREIWQVRQRWKTTKVLPVVFPSEEWADRQAA
jgi:dolichyl-phosphate beta-glucosyltransferase